MSQNTVFGKIPVKNVLLGKRKPIEVYVNMDHPDSDIVSICDKKRIPCKLVKRQYLDKITGELNHQGVACLLPEFTYTPLDDLLKMVKGNVDSTVIMLDGISDPVNFGSIIRSSTAFKVDGIIIGKNRQVPVTGTVSKIATGGEEIIPIVQVTNLTQTIKTLKKEGYWVVCSAGEGKDVYDEIDYRGKICLVVGSEGFGVSKLVRENSDFVASIPLPGQVKALNAAIATAVFLAEINSNRRKHIKKQ